MSPVVSLTDISKTYVVRRRAGRLRRHRSEVAAVDGIALEIEAGEMVGYLGPNGAGKSTTIKMITGILEPTAGRIRVLDLVPTRQRPVLAQRIGVVFGQRSQLWWDLPLRDSFDLLQHLYRTEPSRHRSNLLELADRLALGGFLDTPVRQLSLGQRMRGELTASLLHDPDLVVLDEPTIGLDVVSKHEVREFLVERNRQLGTTVLLTTHDLDDVEAVCERMLVIDRGAVLLDDDVTSFKERHRSTRTLVVEMDDATSALDLPAALAGVTDVEHEGPRVKITFDRRLVAAADLIAAVASRHRVRDLTVEEPTIETLVKELYQQPNTPPHTPPHTQRGG